MAFRVNQLHLFIMSRLWWKTQTGREEGGVLWALELTPISFLFLGD